MFVGFLKENIRTIKTLFQRIILENRTTNSYTSSDSNKPKPVQKTQSKVQLVLILCLLKGYTVVSQQFSINCKHSQSDKNVITNVMLNTGSQLTFIHENLQKILNLPTLYTKSLNIRTFMNTDNEAKTYDVVKVTLHNNEVYLDVVAIVVPQTASLSTPTTVNVLNEPGFKLCMPPNVKYGDEVGVLVGMDYYWRILTGPT